MMKATIGTFLKGMLLMLVFVSGYILAHQNVPIPPIDKAIDKVSNFCGDKK